MTWLFIPSACLPSAPASDRLSSPSSSPSQQPALWVQSNGTASQQPSSWRGWRTRPWKRLLSGTTLPPSTADRGVEQWTASLRDSPASRSAPPASGLALRMIGGSGRTLPVSFARFDRATSSWKTAPDLFGQRFPASSATWPHSGSMRSGTVFRRASSGRRMSGSGCTSWPTPTAADSGRASVTYPRGSGNFTLLGAAAMWPTPDAAGTERINTSPTSRTEHPTLALAAREWATPTAEPFRSRSGERKDELGLDRQVKAWATPTAQDQSGSGNRSPGYGPTLTDQAVRARAGRNWPTPTAHNGQDTGAASELMRKDPQLSAVAMQCSLNLGLQTRSISPDGVSCLQSNLVLNPLFDEMLMGWPRGWTVCGASVTGLSRWLQLWRSYACLIG